MVAQYWDASNQALDVQPSFLLGLLHAILIMLLGVVLVRPVSFWKLVGSIVPDKVGYVILAVIQSFTEVLTNLAERVNRGFGPRLVLGQ